MLVDELIAELKELRDKYGNVPVGKMYTTRLGTLTCNDEKAVRHVEPRGGLLRNLLTVEHDIFKKKNGSPVFTQHPIDEQSVEEFTMDMTYIIVI
jgi:hypothetical protein